MGEGEWGGVGEAVAEGLGGWGVPYLIEISISLISLYPQDCFGLLFPFVLDFFNCSVV